MSGNFLIGISNVYYLNLIITYGFLYLFLFVFFLYLGIKSLKKSKVGGALLIGFTPIISFVILFLIKAFFGNSPYYNNLSFLVVGTLIALFFLIRYSMTKEKYRGVSLFFFIFVIILLIFSMFLFYIYSDSYNKQLVIEPMGKITENELKESFKIIKNRLSYFGFYGEYIGYGEIIDNKIIFYVSEYDDEQLINGINDILRIGKFEAKMGDQLIFEGNEEDIIYVCRDSGCSGIDPNHGCGVMSNGDHTCRFGFSISLSQKSAKRFADVTKNIKIVTEGGYDYLEQDIVLYLDDIEVDSLKVSAELKGREVTDIQISGSGVGKTYEEAVYISLSNMKRLQPNLIHGALPVAFNVTEMK